MKIAFSTTFFPVDNSYIDDFFVSLQSQDYKNFDLIILNDGFEGLERFIDKYSSLCIKELRFHGTVAENREQSINYILSNNYDVVVFGDCDDYFSSNRISNAIKVLKGFDIAVNDLSVFDENGIIEELYISHRYNDNQEIFFNDIKEKNFFGLSNTACRVNALKNIGIPKDLIAVDWYVFSNLLLRNKTSVFTNKSVTYYRQHSENTVGLQKFNRSMLLKSLKVKKKHYKEMQKIDKGFKQLSKKNQRIMEMITDDGYEKKLASSIKQKTPYPLWWEY